MKNLKLITIIIVLFFVLSGLYVVLNLLTKRGPPYTTSGKITVLEFALVPRENTTDAIVIAHEGIRNLSVYILRDNSPVELAKIDTLLENEATIYPFNEIFQPDESVYITFGEGLFVEGLYIVSDIGPEPWWSVPVGRIVRVYRLLH